MPSGKLCCIPGCEKPAIARGWCPSHYWRWSKHGDPTAGRTPVGAPMKFIMDVALPYSGKECLIWPYARSGPDKRECYVFYEGGMRLAHRVVCRLAHGEPPSDEHHAAHECGNGHLGCISPEHLSWKTPVENEADKIRHGTKLVGSRVGNSRLREDQIGPIMALQGIMSAERVADHYGVHFNTIRKVWQGRSWGWLTGQGIPS